MSKDELFKEEAAWHPVENPKFPVASVVKVAADHQPDQRDFPEVHTRGWHGRIMEAHTDGTTVIYTLQLDSLTIDKLPAAYLKMLCEEGPLPYFEFTEDELETAESRDTAQEATIKLRATYHRYFWGNIEEDQQANRIYQIMMKRPAADDLDNWLDYFQHEVHYPLPAVAAGIIFNHLPYGTPVEVVGIEGLDQEGEFGLIASVKKGRAIISYPLMELGPDNGQEENKQSWPLKDYRYWADFML